MSRDLTPEWILKETLAVQKQAISDYVSAGNGLTMTVVGCGTMGIAILGGIMDSLSAAKAQSNTSEAASNGTSTGSSEDLPSRLPSKFNACVRRQESADRITRELGKYDAKLSVYKNDNITPVKEADIILLSCKPYMVASIMASDEMRSALEGKLLISILAGVTESQLVEKIYGDQKPANAPRIVRAMPNTAAAVRESMTVIGTTDLPLPQDTRTLITWIFTRIGKVSFIPSTNMDVCTALCGSGPAFVSVILESLAAGAIAMGLPREEAYTMAAQTMRGTTALVQAGEHPAILRDKVTTPGGCTIGGLLVLEEGSIRGTVARAVREATVVASQLGQGRQGVNGTRH